MKHKFFVETSIRLGQESKCVSKKVGAIIVRDGRIISTGYNGTISGYHNCNDIFDGDIFDKDEHHRWSLLHEIHAEQNALMMAAKYGIAVNNCVMYTSLQPCNNCLKLIMASGIRHIVFYESYDKSDYSKEVLDMINHWDLIIEQYEDICRPRD
jgi:dCMP deaminase